MAVVGIKALDGFVLAQSVALSFRMSACDTVVAVNPPCLSFGSARMKQTLAGVSI